MLTGQAGNPCVASLIFIESFHGGVNKTKVRHHCFTRPVGITSKNGVNDSRRCSVSCEKTGGTRHRYGYASRGLQDIEETAHGLQQHDVT